tara:strand:+ start:9781 stop:10200 length:420 start_codon:yes stop_codon:yes gene_type:complete
MVKSDHPEPDEPKKPAKRTRKKVAPKKPAAKKSASKKVSGNNNGQYKPEGISKGLEALFFGLEDSAGRRRRKNKKQLCSLIDEYMSAYIVLGYDMDGELVQVTQGKTDKDYDALSVALQKYVFSMAKPPPFPPGGEFEL